MNVFGRKKIYSDDIRYDDPGESDQDDRDFLADDDQELEVSDESESESEYVDSSSEDQFGGNIITEREYEVEGAISGFFKYLRDSVQKMRQSYKL